MTQAVECGVKQQTNQTKQTRGLSLHQYLVDWLIRSQSQEEAQVNTPNSVLVVDNQEKSELKPTQAFSFVGYEYHLHSALVKPTQERWLKLQDLILRLKTCFDCKMFDVAKWVTCLNGENGPGSPQGALEISSVAGQPPSQDRNDFFTPRLVAEPHKRDDRCRPLCQRPQHPTLTDASNEGWGAHLNQCSTKGLWSDGEKSYT